MKSALPVKPPKWRMAVMGFPGHWRFMGPLTAARFQQLADLGFNAVILWVSQRVSASCRPGSKMEGIPDVPGRADWWAEPETLDRIASIGEMARQSRLGLFATLYACGGAQTVGDISLPAARSEEGAASKAICPVASELWEEHLCRQALAWAPHADGVLFDLEVQAGRDAAGAAYWKKHCCCERCLADFLGGRVAAEASARPRLWLEQAGRWAAFVRHQEQRAFGRVSAWRASVRRVRPQARVGFYGHTPGEDGWRINQIARALYVEGSPILLLDSATYWESCVRRSPAPGKVRTTIWDWEKRQRAALRNLGVEAEICFGCFPGSPASNYSLKEIERHAFISETCGEGYWVWNERRDPFELQHAYQAANDWLNLAASRSEEFFNCVKDRVRCAEEQGFDTAFSLELLKRAESCRASGDMKMAQIWAYQSSWSLGK